MSLPDRVQRFDFPGGYAGTVATVKLFAELVRRRYQDPRMRARARELFAGTGMRDVSERLQRLFDFIVAHVTYIANPLGVQHVTDPVRLDQEIDEDNAGESCAGIAVYAATVLAAAGIRSDFEIIGWDPKQPDKFKHIALRVYGPSGQSVSFDPVGAMAYGEDTFGLGDTLARDGLPVEYFDLEGDQLGDIGDEVRSFFDSVKQGAGAFGPYGALASGLIQVGEDIYDKASGQHVGKVTTAPASQQAGGRASLARAVQNASGPTGDQAGGGKHGKGKNGDESSSSIGRWLLYGALAIGAYKVL